MHAPDIEEVMTPENLDHHPFVGTAPMRPEVLLNSKIEKLPVVDDEGETRRADYL